MMLSVIDARDLAFHGSETNHTDKLTAGLLLDMRIVTEGTPEM